MGQQTPTATVGQSRTQYFIPLPDRQPMRARRSEWAEDVHRIALVTQRSQSHCKACARHKRGNCDEAVSLPMEGDA